MDRIANLSTRQMELLVRALQHEQIESGVSPEGRLRLLASEEQLKALQASVGNLLADVGFKSDSEPTALGLELERLIDVLSSY